VGLGYLLPSAIYHGVCFASSLFLLSSFITGVQPFYGSILTLLLLVTFSDLGYS